MDYDEKSSIFIINENNSLYNKYLNIKWEILIKKTPTSTFLWSYKDNFFFQETM